MGGGGAVGARGSFGALTEYVAKPGPKPLFADIDFLLVILHPHALAGDLQLPLHGDFVAAQGNGFDQLCCQQPIDRFLGKFFVRYPQAVQFLKNRPLL